jgi:hypothetical protein
MERGIHHFSALERFEQQPALTELFLIRSVLQASGLRARAGS